MKYAYKIDRIRLGSDIFTSWFLSDKETPVMGLFRDTQHGVIYSTGGVILGECKGTGTSYILRQKLGYNVVTKEEYEDLTKRVNLSGWINVQFKGTGDGMPQVETNGAIRLHHVTSEYAPLHVFPEDILGCPIVRTKYAYEVSNFHRVRGINVGTWRLSDVSQPCISVSMQGCFFLYTAEGVQLGKPGAHYSLENLLMDSGYKVATQEEYKKATEEVTLTGRVKVRFSGTADGTPDVDKEGSVLVSLAGRTTNWNLGNISDIEVVEK